MSNEDVRLQTPLNDLTIYQWGTFTAKDYFCPVCGMLPFRRPSQLTAEEAASEVEPFDGWAINTRCLEDFDPSVVPSEQVHGSKIQLP